MRSTELRRIREPLRARTPLTRVSRGSTAATPSRPATHRGRPRRSRRCHLPGSPQILLPRAGGAAEHQRKQQNRRAAVTAPANVPAWLPVCSALRHPDLVALMYAIGVSVHRDDAKRTVRLRSGLRPLPEGRDDTVMRPAPPSPTELSPRPSRRLVCGPPQVRTARRRQLQLAQTAPSSAQCAQGGCPSDDRFRRGDVKGIVGDRQAAAMHGRPWQALWHLELEVMTTSVAPVIHSHTSRREITYRSAWPEVRAECVCGRWCAARSGPTRCPATAQRGSRPANTP